MSDLPATGVPRHIAIIMDGNGRWAKLRGKPRRDGHRAGADSVKRALDGCRDLGISWLTLYAFSSENWNRPKPEVEALMLLLDRFLSEKLPEMLKNNIRLHAIGNLSRLPEKTRKRLSEACQKTASNSGVNLVLALSYGSREEILHAARSLATDAANGTLSPDSITEELFSSRLYTAGMPDPDLVIRTSGEMRLSNFLLWQLSYAEILVMDKLWPDFTADDIKSACHEFARRHRRFGAL